MFDKIIRFSLTHRMLIVVTTALTIVYGGIALQKLPVDVFPDLNKPTVNILTVSQGMAPEEIETVITKPVETVLNGMPGVTKIYSSSATGISVVRVEFEWGTDLRFARLAVSERLPLARERMPEGVTPFLSPTSSIMGEIQLVGLISKDPKIDLTELRTVADWTLKPRLLTVPGVSQVTVLGGGQRQIQILVNAEKLRKRQINILELREKVAHISEASGGGFITAGQKEWLIRNFARVRNYEEIPNTPVGMHFGVPVLLKDVAKVEFAPAPKRGNASISGEPGIVLMIQKQSAGDTVKISEAVDGVLAEIQTTLPKGIAIQGQLFKQADFIKSAIGNVEEALRDGSLMVALVLIVFLLNFRTTAITLTAIPLSLLVTSIVFHIFGISVNTMTLGGLAIAMGELVDDAIVGVENVLRRLRENQASLKPKPVLQVIFDASREVRNSIVLATLITVLVFVPLFALPGLEGRLFTPIGISYIVSLVASLLVSLTVTPILCFYLLPKTLLKEKGDGPLVRWLKALDKSILERTLEKPKFVIIGSLVAALIASAIVPFMGRNFLPPFNEGSAMAEVGLKPGISLEASTALAREIEKSILQVPEVASTGTRIGRADEDDHAAGVNQIEAEIALRPSKRSRTEVFEDIRAKIQPHVPGDGYFGLTQPISHRLDHILSGVKAQVAIKLVGPDLRFLRQQAAEIKTAVRDVEGIKDLRVEGQVLFPQYKIYAMRNDIAKYGIVPGELMRSLETMLQGSAVTRIIEQDRFLDVFLRLDEESRGNIESIKNIPAYVLPTGQVVKLDDVAYVFETSGPSTIERENLHRRMAISFNTVGRDIESIVNEAKKKIASDVKLEPGYYVEIGGQYESQKSAVRIVALLGVLSVLGVFLVLFANFKSVSVALQILVNVPLALIGAVIAVLLTDRTFSIATLIAFITLCGIASRNGIMLISHYIHLMKEEGETFSKEMIIRGSLERLVPVLMTAFSAILALSPLLLAKDQPGKEILHPVAVVIIGGLLSSTLLDIFVTPAIFYRFGRKSAERLVNRKPNAEELINL